MTPSGNDRKQPDEYIEEKEEQYEGFKEETTPDEEPTSDISIDVSNLDISHDAPDTDLTLTANITHVDGDIIVPQQKPSPIRGIIQDIIKFYEEGSITRKISIILMLTILLITSMLIALFLVSKRLGIP